MTSQPEHFFPSPFGGSHRKGAAMPQASLVVSIAVAGSVLQHQCHSAAKTAGWWLDPETGQPEQSLPHCFANRIALIHAEVSRALQGDLSGKKDHQLPLRSMREVALAEAVIRIFDLAGAYQMDLGGVIEEKMQLNAQRPGHKRKTRSGQSGQAL